MIFVFGLNCDPSRRTRAVELQNARELGNAKKRIAENSNVEKTSVEIILRDPVVKNL